MQTAYAVAHYCIFHSILISNFGIVSFYQSTASYFLSPHLEMCYFGL